MGMAEPRCSCCNQPLGDEPNIPTGTNSARHLFCGDRCPHRHIEVSAPLPRSRFECADCGTPLGFRVEIKGPARAGQAT